MPIVMIKDAPVKMPLKGGKSITLKGFMEINIVGDDEWRELLAVNPHVSKWIDNGTMIMNVSNAEHAKTDLIQKEEQAETERKVAAIQAGEVMKEKIKARAAELIAGGMDKKQAGKQAAQESAPQEQ